MRGREGGLDEKQTNRKLGHRRNKGRKRQRQCKQGRQVKR